MDLLSLCALGLLPFCELTKPLKTAALVFPTGWAMQTLHGLISFGQDLAELRWALVVLAAFALVFTAIASRSLRID